jgi:hypothetical protein
MINEPPTTSTDDSDHRFNISLLAAITTVLEECGYTQPTEQAARNRATGQTLSALYRLVAAFEGEGA